MAATEKFDMIPVREKESFDPQPWDGSEVSLPGNCAEGGYFLRDGEGEKVVVGGKVVRALATRRESNGRFSIYEVQAGKLHAGKGEKEVRFKDTHHAFYTVEGVLKLVIDGSEVKTTAGETTFVPAGTKWRFDAESAWARAYVFANGGGIGEIMSQVGSKYEFSGLPDQAENWDEGKVKGLESELGFVVV